MDAPEHYAHTPGAGGGWHPLSEHLQEVAELARCFAEPFGAGNLAYWMGLWHDTGKISPEFQQYLRAQHEGRSHPIVPHAVWGAALAYRLIARAAGEKVGWKQIAAPISGHHGGLSHGGTLAQDLEEFLAKRPEALSLVGQYVTALPTLPKVRLPRLEPHREELFIRMLFSALVDADYLDTERHFHPGQSGIRGGWPELIELRDRLQAHQRGMIERAHATVVNRVRREVYEACVASAPGPPGVYRLTVPTGGGKTLSGLAFALQHGVTNKLRRVVVAIPYTSIIDQTAHVYRDILGDQEVLEHHSQIIVPEDESQDARQVRLRLATENWDAPLVVTTTVQLLESLLANRPSRVRKLHNLARSVIVMDEVQTLPMQLLEPTLDVLRTLVEGYGVTIVLSTATHPTFEDTPYIRAFQGLAVAEIVPDYLRHFEMLDRVSYDVRHESLSWDSLAAEVCGESQVMVVLNRRRDALALIDALGETGDVFHLSSLLCGAHRKAILEEVKCRLDIGQPRPARLISTQVVEAGVDLDFPVVWRAVGPLDRIVQAAGRCNREGIRPEKGQVIVFEPVEGGAPGGAYKAGIEEARLLLKRHGPEELRKPTLYREYFQRLFSVVPLDKKQIQPLRGVLDYPEVARRYRLIDDDTVPVVVPYGDGFERLRAWQRAPDRTTWQSLQPYLVNVFSHEAQRLETEGWLEPLSEGLYHWLGEYDERRGLVQALHDPSDLVI